MQTEHDSPVNRHLTVPNKKTHGQGHAHPADDTWKSASTRTGPRKSRDDDDNLTPTPSCTLGASSATKTFLETKMRMAAAFKKAIESESGECIQKVLEECVANGFLHAPDAWRLAGDWGASTSRIPTFASPEESSKLSRQEVSAAEESDAKQKTQPCEESSKLSAQEFSAAEESEVKSGSEHAAQAAVTAMIKDKTKRFETMDEDGLSGQPAARARRSSRKRRINKLRQKQQELRLERQKIVAEEAQKNAEEKAKEDAAKVHAEQALRLAQVGIDRIINLKTLDILKPPKWVPKAKPPVRPKTVPAPKPPPKKKGSFAVARAIFRLKRLAQEARQKIFVVDRGTNYTKVGWAHEAVPLLTVQTEGKTAWTILNDAFDEDGKPLKNLCRNRPVLIAEDEVPRDYGSLGHDGLFDDWCGKFGCMGWYTTDRAVVALQSSGRRTGLVLDMSGSAFRVVPVYEGCAIDMASDSCNQFGSTAVEEGYSQFIDRMIMDPAAAEKCKAIKEEQGRVALHYNHEIGTNRLEGSVDIAMQTTELRWELITIPEMFFTTALKWQISEKTSIIDMVYDSIMACDQEIRYLLVRNIVLTSKGTAIRGMKERIAMELADRLPPIFDIIIEDISGEESDAAWKGACMMANSGRFQNMFHRDRADMTMDLDLEPDRG